MTCFLYVSDDDRTRERAESADRFTDAVRDDVGPDRRQVAMVSWDGTLIEALALQTRGARVASYKINITLSDFFQLDHPIDIEALAGKLDPVHGERLRTVAATGGGTLPSDTARALQAAIDNNEYGPWFDLEELATAEPPPLWPEDHEPVVAYERDAVGLSLWLAGLDRDRVMRSWRGESNEPFLTALTSFQLMEDQIIAGDAQVFGDWTYIGTSMIGATRFEQSGRRLTVLNVNKQRVENNLGCDLIYYVRTYDAYVLVQYKRMQHEPGGWAYRPDRQLDEELARMRAIATPPTVTNEASDHRLGGNFCFLKLCKSEVADPFSGELSQGMYIPLDYWDKLESGGQLHGPRGGRVATFGNVDRYLTNTDFVALVQRSWVGTRGVTSGVIQEVIERALDAKYSLILAAGDSHPTRPFVRGRVR